MAVMGRGADQYPFHLAGLTRPSLKRVLGRGKAGELHLAPAWHCSIFCRRLGARLEMALSAGTDQEDPHQDHVPHHRDRLYGQ